MDADDGLRASDRTRLVGLDGSPDAALVTKERMDHLQGAFDELSDVHTRVLVMRELEGMSYREIGEKLELTRPAVESALFRARRRLESEYSELSEGRRCEAMAGTIARIAAGVQRGAEEQRLARHARRCHSLPPPRARAWDRAAVRTGRAAQEGRGAAAAALDFPPLRRGRRRAHRILRIGCRYGTAGGTCRGSGGRGGAGGCGRRGTRNRRATGGPRGGRQRPGRGRALRGRDGRTAARRHRSRHGRRAAGNAPGVRAESFRSGRGPRRPFARRGHWHRSRTAGWSGRCSAARSAPSVGGGDSGLPALPRTDSGQPAVERELRLPETPRVTVPQVPALPQLPPVEVPPVQLPPVQLPDTGPVQDALPNVLP